jgi:hypothetical protein
MMGIMESTGTSIDTSYRMMSVEELTALKLSALQAIQAIAGTGQSHSLNGRQTTHASLAEWRRTLTNVCAALEWKGSVDAAYGAGSASRYDDYSSECP